MASDDLIHWQTGDDGPRLLFIEPYLADSHRALVDGLTTHVPARWQVLGLAGRFFRWRMRGAAPFLAQSAARVLSQGHDGIICSAMLNLAELRGLCPALARVPALAYFHENQLAYPTPGQADAAQQERDLFLAFSNLTTALAAQRAVFNSAYHRAQFLTAAEEIIGRMPDARPVGMLRRIEELSVVMPVPIEPAAPAEGRPHEGPLRILWNHRWEHDKGPEEFFGALAELAESGAEFQVAVLGRRFGRCPEVFDQAAELLGHRLARLGWAETRAEYQGWLAWADVVVSTARQENQGLAVAEAVAAGCRPCVPGALVYPELYAPRFLYQPGKLPEALLPMARDPEAVRGEDYRPLAEPMIWPAQQESWQRLIMEVIDGRTHA